MRTNRIPVYRYAAVVIAVLSLAAASSAQANGPASIANIRIDNFGKINGNYYRDHHFTAKVAHQVGLIVIDASLDFWLRNYQGINAAIGAPSRDDVIFAGRLGGQYVYKDWMAFTAGYQVTSLATDYMTVDPTGADDPSYTRHELLVGVKAAF